MNTEELNTEESCVATIKKGAYLALGLVVLILGVFLIGKLDIVSASISGFQTGILGIFVYRKSRIAATLLMILVTVITLGLFIQSGSITNMLNHGLFAIVWFVYLSFQAMMATYDWHKYYK